MENIKLYDTIHRLHHKYGIYFEEKDGTVREVEYIEVHPDAKMIILKGEIE